MKALNLVSNVQLQKVARQHDFPKWHLVFQLKDRIPNLEKDGTYLNLSDQRYGVFVLTENRLLLSYSIVSDSTIYNCVSLYVKSGGQWSFRARAIGNGISSLQNAEANPSANKVRSIMKKIILNYGNADLSSMATAIKDFAKFF